MKYIFIINIVLLIVLYIYLEFFYKKKGNSYNKSQNYYTQKAFMTNQEIYFYKIFKELENELDIIIHPQTNLATIVDKLNGYRRNELFRNIDFAVFSKDYKRLIFLIEINDKTHQRYNRKKRDKTVKEICDCAKIKLITFYTNYSNKEEYVINRFKETYNEIINKENI